MKRPRPRRVTRLGVLVPSLGATPVPPSRLPFGRAASFLAEEGIEIVFGDRAEGGRLLGVQAEGSGWSSTRLWQVAAVFARFPAQSRAERWARLRVGLAATPIANPPSLAALCADKIRTQQLLAGRGIPMPEVEPDPRRFAAALAGWHSAFLKPRFGAFGRGIRKVNIGDELSEVAEGAVPGILEPTFLQRALPAPEGWAGVSCRVLVQRLPDGGWHVDPVVARSSRTDPVVNAARGASVTLLGAVAPAAVVRRVAGLAERCAHILADQPAGELLVEVGVDVALDRALEPWVLELNGTPRGRLEALRVQSPDRFEAAHVASCCRPLRYLALRFG